MLVPDEIAKMLETKVDAQQLLFEFNKFFNTMTYEELECTIKKEGSMHGMKKIIEKLPKFDNWDYHLVKALSSDSIQKNDIAKKFSKYFCEDKPCSLKTLLIHFEYFSCLDCLNAANLNTNWKNLVKKLEFTEEEITRIELQHDENYMRHVMKILAYDKIATLDYLLLALKELNLHVYEDILVGVGLKHPTSRQNRQADHHEIPRTTPNTDRQPQSDHYKPSETRSEASTQSVNSFFNIKRKEEKTKSFNDKFSSSADDTTHERFPTECSSLGRRDVHTASIVLDDQQNALNKLNNFDDQKKQNIHVMEHTSSSEDSIAEVKTTPVYPYASANEEQIESSFDETQDEEENSLNIPAPNLNISSEERQHVEPPNEDGLDDENNADEEVGISSSNKYLNICTAGIIVILGLLALRYFRR